MKNKKKTVTNENNARAEEAQVSAISFVHLMSFFVFVFFLYICFSSLLPSLCVVFFQGVQGNWVSREIGFFFFCFRFPFYCYPLIIVPQAELIRGICFL